MAKTYEGGCNCGAVRFSYDCTEETKPMFSGYCHCQVCRRANGASGIHLMGVPAAAFKVSA